MVVAITFVNGIAEELFFRGALYTAFGRFYPVLISTVLYVGRDLGERESDARIRRDHPRHCAARSKTCATGGVLAPVLTHLIWGLVMVLGLPPMFGV